MVEPTAEKAVVGRVRESSSDRAKVRALISEGRGLDAEDDIERRRSYIARHVESALPRGAEAIQGDTSDLQPARFLPLGALVRRAVGYVEVDSDTESDAGTGFLISPRLFITNCHVIGSADAARAAVVTFDLELDGAGRRIPTTT